MFQNYIEAFNRKIESTQSITWLKRPAWRKAVLAFAAIGFTIGCLLSARSLNLTWANLSLCPFLILACVLAPLSILYAAVNMALMARAARVQLPFASSLRVATLAQLAELLPLPGGAIVRGAALTRSGAKVGLSVSSVLSSAVLWLSCSGLAAGIVLHDLGWPAWILVGGGLGGTIAASLWLGRLMGWRLTFAALILRIFGLILMGLRLAAAFATLGITVSFAATLPFAFATIAGSAASIAPSGLGISEGLAAMFAHTVAMAPAAGFASVALNRVTGVAVTGIAAAVMALSNNSKKTLAHG